MSRRLLAVLALALVALAFACSGEKAPSGATEPFRLKNGAFKAGPLPGAPPIPDTAGPPPAVTTIEAPSALVRPGQVDKTVLGHVSTDAVAVAVALDGLGTGYWVVPAGAPDPAVNGELTWSLTLDFADDLPAGKRDLRVVAIAPDGRAGTQRALPICVASKLPDNLASCNDKQAPPAVVVTLSWDAPVDLDLVVAGPDGRIVDPKHPRTGIVDAGADASAVGTIDRDSNGGCVVDRIQREDLVWQSTPAPGSYLVYANLFDACGRAPVHFHLTVNERQPGSDGRLVLVETVVKDGLLTALDANGGATLGTFVTELVIQ